jgi:hypothetical protein
VQLYTSYWQSPVLKDVDAQMVAISRGKPRWKLPFRYRVLAELAPDNHTWAQEDQEAFTASYLRQLEELGTEAILARLERLSGGLPVVALCWEDLSKPGQWCHRSLLASWLELKTGLVAPELQPGMISARQDSADLRLF